MTRTTTPLLSLPAPTADLLHGRSLFLDLDGTLFELVDCPSDVVADAEMRALLTRLSDRLDGRLAIVSGRSLAQMDIMLGPVAQRLALSGSHGSEHRLEGVVMRPERPAALDEIAEAFHDFARGREGVLVEEKSLGVALHYRMALDVETAAGVLADELAQTHQLKVQNGKMMVELRLPGADKGSAVHWLMARPPMAGTRPVFVGDDLTDEPGFVAAHALGGDGVLVGERQPTQAGFALSHPAAVRAWLEAFAQ